MGHAVFHPTRVSPSARELVVLTPALAAMAYPWVLRAFHAVVTAPRNGNLVLAAALLFAAFLAPATAAAFVLRSAGQVPGSAFEHRARVLALLGAVCPPMFVFIAFLLSILGRPLPELWAWTLAWIAVAAWAWVGGREPAQGATPQPRSLARVLHGVVAAVVLAFIAWHLVNHLLGLLGPEAHKTFMQLGRKLYRLPVVEAALVALLLGQVGLGAWLAWRWSRQRLDGYRAVQVITGVYVGFFALTHMNSALVSARTLHGIATDWAWASGAPEGLLLDAWNIRLVPHYALGVFCVLAHLACGLRGVLLAHGWPARRVNRAWVVGLVVAALVASAILAGLCGLRIG